MYSPEFGDSSDRRLRHCQCGLSLLSPSLPELETAARDLGFPRSPFDVLRLSRPRHLPIYSTLLRTTVIRPAVCRQATGNNESKLEAVNGDSINLFIWRPETRTTSARERSRHGFQ